MVSSETRNCPMCGGKRTLHYETRPELLKYKGHERTIQTPRYEVIESKVWKNTATGQSASIYGAVPYETTAEAEGWAIVTVGFTIRDNVRNTVGIGRKPFETRAEAERVAAEMAAQHAPVAQG